VGVSDEKVENNQYIQLNFSANQGTTQYSRTALLTYNTITNKPLFVLKAIPSSYTIIGNDIESQSGIINVSNNGNTASAAGRITSSEFTNDATFFTTNYGPSCGIESVLQVGESCNVFVRLNAKNENSPNGESGIANYQVGYTGLVLCETGTIATPINYNITPNQQGFTITNVAVIGNRSGSGTIGDVYIFGGDTAANSKVTITYKNSGTNLVYVLGVNESNTSNIYWKMEPFVATQVPVHGTFSITYTNQLGNMINNITNTLLAPNENITLPTIYFQDNSSGVSSLFQQTVRYQDRDTIYADGRLGSVSNTITTLNRNTTFESFQVTAKLNPNGGNYGAITQNIALDIASNNLASSDGCSSSEIDNITKISCNINDTASKYAVYSINPLYIISESLNINASFNPRKDETITNGQAVVINPVFQRANLPQIYWTTEASTSNIKSESNALGFAIGNDGTRYIAIIESSTNGSLKILSEKNQTFTTLGDINDKLSSTKPYVSLAVYGATPYTAYTNLDNHLVVKKFINPNWQDVATGLPNTTNLYYANIKIDNNGTIYVSATTAESVTCDITEINPQCGGNIRIFQLASNNNSWTAFESNSSSTSGHNSLAFNPKEANYVNVEVRSIGKIRNIRVAYQDINADDESGTGWVGASSGETAINKETDVNSLSLSIDANGNEFVFANDTTNANNPLIIGYYPYNGTYPKGSAWNNNPISFSNNVTSIASAVSPKDNSPYVTFIQGSTTTKTPQVFRYAGGGFTLNNWSMNGMINTDNINQISIAFDPITKYPVVVYVNNDGINIHKISLSKNRTIKYQFGSSILCCQSNYFYILISVHFRKMN
jgi:hypothetical protein